jgi:DNA-binding NtrC family response regulator
MSSHNNRVLVVGPETEPRCRLCSLLGELGLNPVLAATLTEAEAILSRHALGLIFCEDVLPDGSFADFLHAVERQGPPVPVVVCSDAADWGVYLEAMEHGAFDYISRPYRRMEVEWTVSSALGKEVVAPKKQKITTIAPQQSAGQTVRSA